MDNITGIVKEYIINTESIDVLVQFLGIVYDNLDVKFNMYGLNRIYATGGHRSVLEKFFESDTCHINIKKYCHEYGVFDHDSLIHYVEELSHDELCLMTSVFRNIYSIHTYRQKIIESIVVDKLNQ